ncbi:hypothetical protein DERP_002244 [Dermatophagoides pteronyssinus]|uniref:Uncharacterized protein n=1 Tax=Dermatophagoides pteronyssinus TaxID=6956 RepID=A0ABQ8JH67_DERPT|nr:hypothetical protein DERP_002244 [Dermatophagoides pteronyssinus]
MPPSLRNTDPNVPRMVVGTPVVLIEINGSRLVLTTVAKRARTKSSGYVIRTDVTPAIEPATNFNS